MIDINIKNVSGLQNFSTKIDSKGLYIIEGENTSGKTSFITSFLSLIKSANFQHKIKPKNGFPEFEISYKKRVYGYPNKSTHFMSKNINAQTLSFCDSENKIVNIIMKNKKSSQKEFNSEIINLLGYQSYQKMLDVSRSMLTNYDDKITELSGKLLTINHSQIIIYIEETKKEIKEIEENISDLYSYILEITKKRVQLSNVETIILEIEEKIDNLYSGKKINLDSIIFPKNIGIDKIREKIKSLNLNILESKEPYEALKKLLILKNEQKEQFWFKKSEATHNQVNINKEIKEIMKEKDNQYLFDLESKLKRFRSEKKCSECETKITKEIIKIFQERIKNTKISLVEKERTVSRKKKEERKVIKKLKESNDQMDKIIKEINLITEKIQDYESFVKQSEKEIHHLENILLQGEAIEEVLQEDLNEKQKLKIIYQTDIDTFDDNLINQYNDLKETFEQQKKYLKDLENKKKEHKDLQSSKKNLNISKNKLLYLYNYIDNLLNTTLKSFEQEITKSLDSVSKKLNLSFSKIKFENGKIDIKQNNRIVDFSKLSTAERSSLIIILLYNMKKFLLPEFPFFFIDDIGGFDSKRQENIIRFISDDINSLNNDLFCFVTITKKDSDLSVYKYQNTYRNL